MSCFESVTCSEPAFDYYSDPNWIRIQMEMLGWIFFHRKLLRIWTLYENCLNIHIVPASRLGSPFSQDGPDQENIYEGDVLSWAWRNIGKMPGQWNTGRRPRKKCLSGGEQPKPSPAHLRPQKTSSRNLAAMEETCAKSTPYSFEAWHNRVQWLTERIVFVRGQIIILFNWHPIHFTCTVLRCVYNCCISSRRINHCGALLHALILCLRMQDSSSCVEH